MKSTERKFQFLTREDPDTGARVTRLTPPDVTCHRNYFYQKCFTNDGTKLIQREDDKQTAVKRRLQEYDGRTAPLIDYYRTRSLFHVVNGHRPQDTVFGELLDIVTHRPARKAPQPEPRV